MFVIWKRRFVGFLFFALVLALAVPAAGGAALRGDFSNNGTLTTEDVVFLLSWVQSGRTNNGSLIVSLARELMPSIAQPLYYFPAVANDDYNNDSTVTTDDVVFFLAWIQAGRTSNATLIGSLAKELMSTVKGTIQLFPGTTLAANPAINTAVDTGTGTSTGSGTGTGSDTGTGTSTGTTTGASVTITIDGIVPN